MPNRLASSTSPYLRQHADNPVDWYEWGPQALSRAKDEDKPILLSVGYSSCHWCHVMAHESFEDEATAALMNERFVNIKVDREERPDIDAIYQRVVQLMGQGGGWPLTVFLTPEQEPFYGGTYFPPQARYGRPSFTQLLVALDRLYREDRERLTEQTQAFREGFEQLAASVEHEAEHAKDDPPPDEPAALHLAVKRLLTRVDEQWGGFGSQPKFPNPTALELFAAVARRDEDDPVVIGARRALATTLEKMYRGGIYDHLRGGFARYSVDQVWLVPHFEKMLYDNAQLLPLYAEASVLHPERPYLLRVVRETIDYLEADMRTEDGTFYAATDADSEGEEGKYFCFTPAQVQDVLAPLEAEAGASSKGETQAQDAPSLSRIVCTVYGITDEGNFEHNWSILNLPRPLDVCARELGMDRADLDRALARAREALLAHRYTRVPPHRDDKILTSWNALLVSGLARTAMALQARGDTALADRCEALALTCGAHLHAHHVDADGRVLRAAFEGRVHTRGVLEDVAYLGRACLDLHALTLDPAWLPRARALADHAIAHHLRPSGDGFLLTADDAEALIDRTESQHDGPIPSGLGVMLELLLRLQSITATEAADPGAPTRRDREIIDAVLHRFRGATAQPFGYASVLTAARLAAPNAQHVTLRGPSPRDPRLRALATRVRAWQLRSPVATSLSASIDPQRDTIDAIVCAHQTCEPPEADAETLLATLRRLASEG